MLRGTKKNKNQYARTRKMHTFAIKHYFSAFTFVTEMSQMLHY